MLRQVVLPGGGWVRQVALRVRTLLGELGMPQANGQPLCGRVPKKRGKERHPFFRKEECVHSEEREDAPPHKAAGLVSE